MESIRNVSTPYNFHDGLYGGPGSPLLFSVTFRCSFTKRSLIVFHFCLISSTVKPTYTDEKQGAAWQLYISTETLFECIQDTSENAFSGYGTNYVYLLLNLQCGADSILGPSPCIQDINTACTTNLYHAYCMMNSISVINVWLYLPYEKPPSRRSLWPFGLCKKAHQFSTGIDIREWLLQAALPSLS